MDEALRAAIPLFQDDHHWPGRTAFTPDGPSSVRIDEANDENPTKDDNDNNPNEDHIYSIDAPSQINQAPYKELVSRWNFLEFVRISLDNKEPTGNSTSGSRASDKIKWHVRMWSKKDATGNYQPRVGKDADNKIAEGHEPIEPPPTAD